MTHHRTTAEVLAAPFLDPLAFASGTSTVGAVPVCLGPRLNYLRSLSDAANLWRAVWPQHDVGILQTFAQYSAGILRHDGPSARLAPNPNSPGDEILRWRALSLRLPAGMFLAALAAQNSTQPNPRVALLPRWLVPRGPLAHTHVHWNAALDFEALWTHLMSGRDAIGDADGPEGLAPNWPVWVDSARLARVALDAAQTGPDGSITFAEVARLLLTDDADLGVAALQSLADGQLPPNWLPSTGRPSRGLAWLRRALARTRTAAIGAPETKQEVWERDPLYTRNPWPEGEFMTRLWRHVARLPPDDDWHRLFVQYIRLKCRLYTHLVQDPQCTGLEAFIATFNRLKPYRAGLERLRLDHLLDEPELGDALQAIEIRQDPKAPRELGNLCADLGRNAAPQRELGALLHLIRDHPDDNGPAALRKRYFRMAADARNARIALDRDPTRLQWLRGVDLAGNERNGPLWQAVPHLRTMLEAGRAAAAESGLPPLRLTLHVGEDFAHLTSGLRAIHEPIAWGLLEPGDRLGHALALTIDPLRWAADHAVVQQPLIDRLFDLAWLLSIARGAYLNAAHVADEAQLPGDAEPRLAQAWRDALRQAGVEESVDPVDFHRSFADPILLRDWMTIGPSGSGLHRLLAEPFQAGAGPAGTLPDKLLEPIPVRAHEDADLLAVVRLRLARDLLSRQVAIEVNPTSNLVVAGFRHLLDQPMLHLHPLAARRQDGPDANMPSLPIALHADDPLTFATNLGDEFAYAWAGMVAAGGADPQHVRAWLDEAAAVSWRWRFTLPVVAKSPVTNPQTAATVAATTGN